LFDGETAVKQTNGKDCTYVAPSTKKLGEVLKGTITPEDYA